jgi:acyl-CoA thioester hydrolase
MSKEKLTRADFDYFSTIEAHWRDLDSLRHINHAAYLTYMETARVLFYRHLGFEAERWDLQSSTILVRAEVEYLKPAQFPVTFDIGQRITRIGTKSFDILTGLFESGSSDLTIKALFTLVAFNYQLNQSVPVPPEIKAGLHPL